MKNRLLGQVDELSRTLAALTAYLLFKKIDDHFKWEPPWALEQVGGLIIAVLIGGLISTAVWRLPRIVLEWEVQGRPIEGSSVQVRIDDQRSRRLMTHRVVSVGAPSVLGRLVYRRLAGRLRVSVQVTEGYWRVTNDGAQSHLDLELNATATGFSHLIPDLGREGRLATVRMDWWPVNNDLGSIPIEYKLNTEGAGLRLAALLVRLEPTVKSIELVA